MTVLESILSEIDRDSQLDETRLDFELLRIPQIHSRYLNQYTRQSIALRRLQGEYDALKKSRSHFYLGKASDEEYLKERNDFKVLKTDLDMYLSADAKMIAKSTELLEQKLVVETIEKFLNSLRQRGFELRTAVDYIKFKAGA